ncbi:uncharacterized protein PAF06_001064 [Gastrophryne carolinensis]
MNSSSSSLGLLSGYNTSSSDEEETADNTSQSGPSIGSFSARPSSCSNKDNGDKKQAKNTAEPLPSPLLSTRLPAPCLGSQGGASSTGVFSNPYKDKQQAQLSILEHHVKLSDNNWLKGGKGVCLAYQRDGRCRYGTNCKYSHGSDLPPGATAPTPGDLLGSSDVLEMPRDYSLGVQGGDGGAEEIQSQKGKRKKPGLSNTLIPSKKVMKNYQKQLSSERPWAL